MSVPVPSSSIATVGDCAVLAATADGKCAVRMLFLQLHPSAALLRATLHLALQPWCHQASSRLFIRRGSCALTGVVESWLRQLGVKLPARVSEPTALRVALASTRLAQQLCLRIRVGSASDSLMCKGRLRCLRP